MERTVVLLKDVFNLSLEEAAAALEFTVGAVSHALPGQGQAQRTTGGTDLAEDGQPGAEGRPSR